jgi:hypothetical protein
MLPAEDVRYLTDKAYEYVCEPGGSGQLLVIRGFALPPGLTPDVTDLLLDIPSGYPDAGLDMFWVHPVVRISATGTYPPNADQFEPKFNDLTWQRFSRHGYPWQPGQDSIASYLGWITRSFQQDVGALAA